MLEKIKNVGLKTKIGVGTALTTCALTVPAFAAEGASSITDTLSTSIGTIASDAMSAIASVLPVALGIMGAIVVVNIGIKVFKKVTGK